jgi:hypothetical protein
MKIGDLVTIKPAKIGCYLIVGEDPERENRVPNQTGIVLGKLYKLYDPTEVWVADMHEKWIEVVNEVGS